MAIDGGPTLSARPETIAPGAAVPTVIPTANAAGNEEFLPSVKERLAKAGDDAAKAASEADFDKVDTAEIDTYFTTNSPPGKKYVSLGVRTVLQRI